jgi:galactokinase
MDLEALKSEFIKKYGEKNEKLYLFFSPGRVNLIGEHTDYNGGYVFPCALSFGTYLLARKTNDDAIKFATTNFDYSVTISKNQLGQKKGTEWVNYPLGVIEQFKKKGIEVAGLELLYSGNIPNGAGLSSSASIEVVSGVAFNHLFAAGFSMLDIVKMSQKAENEFVGMNCGIMDQFAVAMGKKDRAIFLNCDTLEYELVPVVLQSYKLVITNTNKVRKLTDSKYNERRGECESSVEMLQKARPIKNLGELSLADFKKIDSYITTPIVKKRALHVVSEDQRVVDAVKALKSGDLVAFGKLMNESHDSLRDDYEVTGIELDTLVEEARKVEGVLGSRMTGAGFGGCTVSVVREDKVDEFKAQVSSNYEKRIGIKPSFYVGDVGDGAGLLKEL